MKLILGMAVTHLLARRRATVVAIAGIAVGVGFAIAMASLMEGSQRDFIETLVDATPHISVKDEFRNPPVQPVERQFASGAIRISGLRPKEELRGIRNPRDRLIQIQRIPGVSAAPNLRGQVVMRYGGKDVGASLVGIEPQRERRVSNLEQDLTAGSLDALYRTANGVILGRGLAARLGAGMGDSLTVTSPEGTRLRMKVAGLFRTGVVSLDDGTAYALLKKVQVLQNRPNVVNQIRVRLNNPTAAGRVAQRIEARVGYRAESWEEANEGLLEVLVIRNIIMYTVVGAILVVAAFGIFNVISTITHEKARDIAILKSLGFAEAAMRRMFLLEGLAIGGAGSALGWLLGLGLVFVLSQVRFELSAIGTEMTRLPLAWTVWHYVLAAGFALLSAGIAGYLPARRAARLNPVDIIRGAT
jgi:lipoprotein-releasing system permease protein